jgi:predicted nucleotide-binding protein (sugar kinase/HSP70/actin superfamily)
MTEVEAAASVAAVLEVAVQARSLQDLYQRGVETVEEEVCLHDHRSRG